MAEVYCSRVSLFCRPTNTAPVVREMYLRLVENIRLNEVPLENNGCSTHSVCSNSAKIKFVLFISDFLASQPRGMVNLRIFFFSFFSFFLDPGHEDSFGHCRASHASLMIFVQTIIVHGYFIASHCFLWGILCLFRPFVLHSTSGRAFILHKIFFFFLLLAFPPSQLANCVSFE